MRTVAVFTFPMRGKDGKTHTCNTVDNLEITINEVKQRFDELEKRGYERAGDIILNFVKLQMEDCK